MIRINLAPSKRSRHQDRTQQELMLGFLIILLAGAAVFFFVDRPIREEIDKLDETTQLIRRQNLEKERKLKGFKQLKEAVQAAEKRKAVILKLNNARATPANLLYELAGLLTSKRIPTMTDVMSQEVKDNPNRTISQEWDAKHVWIQSFKEKGGEFTLKGGSQSDSDMTQLALRMQASVYFQDVIPEGGVEVIDKQTGLSYYQFTIKGKVAY